MTRPTRPAVALVNAAAWLADRALTHLFPSPTQAARDLHRTEKAATWLAADNMRLQAEVDTLRAELVKARVEIDRAWGLDAEHFAEWSREFVYDREGEQ